MDEFSPLHAKIDRVQGELTRVCICETHPNPLHSLNMDVADEVISQNLLEISQQKLERTKWTKQTRSVRLRNRQAQNTKAANHLSVDVWNLNSWMVHNKSIHRQPNAKQ